MDTELADISQIARSASMSNNTVPEASISESSSITTQISLPKQKKLAANELELLEKSDKEITDLYYQMAISMKCLQKLSLKKRSTRNLAVFDKKQSIDKSRDTLSTNCQESTGGVLTEEAEAENEGDEGSLESLHITRRVDLGSQFDLAAQLAAQAPASSTTPTPRQPLAQTPGLASPASARDSINSVKKTAHVSPSEDLFCTPSSQISTSTPNSYRSPAESIVSTAPMTTRPSRDSGATMRTIEEPLQKYPSYTTLRSINSSVGQPHHSLSQTQRLQHAHHQSYQSSRSHLGHDINDLDSDGSDSDLGHVETRGTYSPSIGSQASVNEFGSHNNSKSQLNNNSRSGSRTENSKTRRVLGESSPPSSKAMRVLGGKTDGSPHGSLFNPGSLSNLSNSNTMRQSRTAGMGMAQAFKKLATNSSKALFGSKQDLDLQNKFIKQDEQMALKVKMREFRDAGETSTGLGIDTEINVSKIVDSAVPRPITPVALQVFSKDGADSPPGSSNGSSANILDEATFQFYAKVTEMVQLEQVSFDQADENSPVMPDKISQDDKLDLKETNVPSVGSNVHFLVAGIGSSPAMPADQDLAMSSKLVGQQLPTSSSSVSLSMHQSQSPQPVSGMKTKAAKGSVPPPPNRLKSSDSLNNVSQSTAETSAVNLANESVALQVPTEPIPTRPISGEPASLSLNTGLSNTKEVPSAQRSALLPSTSLLLQQNAIHETRDAFLAKTLAQLSVSSHLQEGTEPLVKVSPAKGVLSGLSTNQPRNPKSLDQLQGEQTTSSLKHSASQPGLYELSAIPSTPLSPKPISDRLAQAGKPSPRNARAQISSSASLMAQFFGTGHKERFQSGNEKLAGDKHSTERSGLTRPITILPVGNANVSKEQAEVVPIVKEQGEISVATAKPPAQAAVIPKEQVSADDEPKQKQRPVIPLPQPLPVALPTVTPKAPRPQMALPTLPPPPLDAAIQIQRPPIINPRVNAIGPRVPNGPPQLALPELPGQLIMSSMSMSAPPSHPLPMLPYSEPLYSISTDQSAKDSVVVVPAQIKQERNGASRAHGQ